MAATMSAIARAQRLLGTAALTLLTTACASSGTSGRSGPTPQPFPMPGRASSPPPVTVQADPAAADPAAEGAVADQDDRHRTPDGADGAAESLVGTALDLRGIPYRNGGSTPAGFDCSGFTQYVFARHGVVLPREVRDQFRVGAPVEADDVRPGDLVFFTTTAPGASHVGIALGGDAFVHAPSSTGVVRVERLASRYWSPRLLGIRRIKRDRAPSLSP